MLFLWTIACAPRIEPRDAPEPPDLFEMAENFANPKGSLDTEKASELTDWMLGDGGIAVMGVALIFQSVFPSIFSELESGLNQEGESGTGLEDLPIDGDGWLRMTLPCGGESIDTSKMVLNSLFSTEGLDPRLWGSADQCQWPDLQLGLDAEIGFLIPSGSSMIDGTSWEGEDGKWFSFDGSLDVFDYQIEDALQLMLNSEEQIGILWETGDTRFIIEVPTFDPENLELQLENLEDLGSLSIGITTEEGKWECVLVTGNCSTPLGATFSW
jgi:hypothetical protein